MLLADTFLQIFCQSYVQGDFQAELKEYPALDRAHVQLENGWEQVAE